MLEVELEINDPRNTGGGGGLVRWNRWLSRMVLIAGDQRWDGLKYSISGTATYYGGRRRWQVEDSKVILLLAEVLVVLVVVVMVVAKCFTYSCAGTANTGGGRWMLMRSGGRGIVIVRYHKMTRARETSENARQAKAWVNFDGTFGTSPFTEANGGIRDRLMSIVLLI